MKAMKRTRMSSWWFLINSRSVMLNKNYDAWHQRHTLETLKPISFTHTKHPRFWQKPKPLVVEALGFIHTEFDSHSMMSHVPNNMSFMFPFLHHMLMDGVVFGVVGTKWKGGGNLTVWMILLIWCFILRLYLGKEMFLHVRWLPYKDWEP